MGCAASISQGACSKHRFSQVLPNPEEAKGARVRFCTAAGRRLTKTVRIHPSEVASCMLAATIVQEAQNCDQSLPAGEQNKPTFPCTSSSPQLTARDLKGDQISKPKLHQNKLCEPACQQGVYVEISGGSAFPDPPFIFNLNVLKEPIQAVSLNSYLYEPERLELEMGFPIAPCAPLHRQYLKRLQRSLETITANPDAFKFQVLASRNDRSSCGQNEEPEEHDFLFCRSFHRSEEY